jgi:hypothetical protein
MMHQSKAGVAPAMPATSHALVDGHVHLHDGFGLSVFLDVSAANCAAAAKRLGLRRFRWWHAARAPCRAVGCVLTAIT